MITNIDLSQSTARVQISGGEGNIGDGYCLDCYCLDFYPEGADSQIGIEINGDTAAKLYKELEKHLMISGRIKV